MSDCEERSYPQEMDDEIPSSQLPETEPQSSCETLLSQQSGNDELSEKQDSEGVEGIKSAEISLFNSSLEANTSGENVRSSLTEKTPSAKDLEKSPLKDDTDATEEGVSEHESKGDNLEDKDQEDDGASKNQETRKRKGMSVESTPSPKRQRKEVHTQDTPEEKSKDKSVDSTPSPKRLRKEVGVVDTPEEKPSPEVMEISSTHEKTIVLDDSQEFSLRIEETSPPSSQYVEKSQDSRKDSQEKNSWESHKENVTSPGVSGVSPVAPASPAASVGTIKPMKEENTDNVTQLEVPEKDSSSDDAVGGNTDNVTVREVTDTRTGTMVITWGVDSNNKVISAKLKQLSLIEEYPVDKPGRLSTVSTTSAKSSSSAGSVGLPGLFPLPGKTVRSRLSTLSTVSSSTSSSLASNQAWDGPFLKPQVPGTKLNVMFSCDKCGHHIPPVERYNSSPVINGSPSVEEEELESVEKPPTPKRGRKLQVSHSGSVVSSGPLEEETSSSGSHAEPQASSTPTKLTRGRPRKQQNGVAPAKAVKRGSKSEGGVSTPVRTPRSVGRVKNGTPHPAKKREKGEGVPVLARWGGDGHYYPGWVTEPLTASQVLVRFCDGQSKPTALSKVVKADIITPGTLVLAATPTGEYEEALVVQVDLSGSEPVYMVESDKPQREVQFPSIALQQSTVVELTVSEAQKFAAATNFNDLSLENIIAHPRKRSARTPADGGSGRRKKRQTTPQPCTSHGQTYNGPEETYGDTDSSTHSSCSLDLKGKEIKPLDVECFPPESTRLKLVYNRGNMAYKNKEGKLNDTDAAVKFAGPIPEPGSNLFTDCVFLITYTDTVKLLGYEPYSGIEDSKEAVNHNNLWRDRLRIQIRNGGGKVYNSFSEVTKEELPNTYLITDKQCNTPLYLQCLVNNVPIYSHLVVIQCCTQNRPWKEVISARGVKRMLAGYSLSRQCLVNPRSLTPLRGRTVLLALSGEPSLTNFWQSLIIKVGGSVDLYPRSLEEVKYDVVVTDTDCDRELVAEACSRRVPLVSMTWLQQVIITGEWRPPTEHPLYKYNTSGEGESPEY